MAERGYFLYLGSFEAMDNQGLLDAQSIAGRRRSRGDDPTFQWPNRGSYDQLMDQIERERHVYVRFYRFVRKNVAKIATQIGGLLH